VQIQKPKDGNNSASPFSMLEGQVDKHDNGMAPLALNECGFPIDFDPSDHMTKGGNMVMWDDVKGGKYPWDPRYGQGNPDTSDGFDPTFILNHATDSSATATALATGQKVCEKYVRVWRSQQSV
jgi:alkaline phosphatase